MTNRELDAQTYELIHGIRVYEYLGNNDIATNRGGSIPHYSTNMGDAWKLVMLLFEQGYTISLYGGGSGGCRFNIHKFGKNSEGFDALLERYSHEVNGVPNSGPLCITELVVELLTTKQITLGKTT